MDTTKYLKLLACTFSLILCSMTAEDNYRTVFGSDYDRALQFVKENRRKLCSYSAKYQTDTATVISFLFPELIRYSMLSDFFETTALEILYVEAGKNYADFSIGRFQMKPSFIEKLEHTVVSSPHLLELYSFICNYSSTKETEIRQQRVARLKSIDWQIRYPNCLYEILCTRFSYIQWNSDEEKIKFFAAAYNHGFDDSEENIRHWISERTFPYGSRMKSDHQYSYSEISADFYKTYYTKIFRK